MLHTDSICLICRPQPIKHKKMRWDFIQDEELESISGTDVMEAQNSGDDQADLDQRPTKKKRLHRHAQNQIREMESEEKQILTYIRW